jgi:HD-like signal output (HDOD) protein
MKKFEAFGIIAAQVAQGELTFPTSVNAALQLQLALDNPDYPLEDTIKLVLAEPFLAARTIALANSAAFNRPGSPVIANARAAVMRLGYNTLHSLVAAMVVRQFGSKIVDQAVRAKAQQLWVHTAHVAALAHAFALRLTSINPDTAMFAAIVHEVGSFYLLSRAEEFPGLLEADAENWMASGEELITSEVLKKLHIPEQVRIAIIGLQDGLMNVPPDTLLDTLLLAHHFAPVASPFDLRACAESERSESIIDYVIDSEAVNTILAESEDEVRTMSAALLV